MRTRLARQGVAIGQEALRLGAPPVAAQLVDGMLALDSGARAEVLELASPAIERCRVEVGRARPKQEVAQMKQYLFFADVGAADGVAAAQEGGDHGIPGVEVGGLTHGKLLGAH